MAIMAIDQGTTSSRAIIFDEAGTPLAMDAGIGRRSRRPDHNQSDHMPPSPLFGDSGT